MPKEEHTKPTEEYKKPIEIEQEIEQKETDPEISKDENEDGKDKLSPWFVSKPSEFMECDYERASKFFTDNPKYTESKRPLYQESYKHSLKVVNRVMKKLDIPFWISHGTLLGWYRECGFIFHTNDIDFGVPAEHLAARKNDIIREMKNEGFGYIRTSGKENQGMELQFWHNITGIDLFGFYYEIKPNSQNSETENSEYPDGTSPDDELPETSGTPILTNALWLINDAMKKLEYPYTYFVSVQLEGETVLAPKKAKEWVIGNYGNNWDKPKQSWDYWKDPQNSGQDVFLSQVVPFEQEITFGRNLLKNPSFEETEDNSLTPLGWKGNHPLSVSTSYSFHGRRSLKIIGSKTHERNVKQRIEINQTIATDILVGGFSRPEKPINANDYKNYGIHVKLIYNDDQVTSTWGKWILFDLHATEWHQNSMIITPEKPIAKIDIMVLFNGMNGIVYFDNLYVREKEKCPKDCSNRGQCIFAECHCFKGFKGNDCSQAM